MIFNKQIILVLIILISAIRIFSQEDKLLLVNMDSVFRYSIINKTHQETYNLHLNKHKDLLIGMIDTLQKDWQFCAERAGHTTAIKCKEEQLEYRIEVIRKYENKVSCIQQIVDCYFIEYITDVILKESAIGKHQTSLILDSSDLSVIISLNDAEVSWTNNIINLLEYRMDKDEEFTYMLDNISIEVVELFNENN